MNADNCVQVPRQLSLVVIDRPLLGGSWECTHNREVITSPDTGINNPVL